MARGKNPTQFNAYIQAIVQDLQINEVHIHWHAKLRKNFAGYANPYGHVWLVKNLKAAFTFANEDHYRYQVLRIIAHELRHVWQFQNGKLVIEHEGRLWKWDGVIVTATHITKDGAPNNYEDQPWEHDANVYARTAIVKFGKLVLDSAWEA